MLVLQKAVLFSLLLLLFPPTQTPSKQELNDQLFEAVRKGDVAGATAALDRGADVNAKFRYGTTALFKAAERGNAEIAKLLLDRGADVKVKDTFYGATAMTWALDGGHLAVVKLLLQKSPEDVDDVLLQGARESKQDFVKAALERGGVKAETLTVALVISSEDEKSVAIAEMLKQAGATSPIDVDTATLQSYTGKYKGDSGPESTVTVKDGKMLLSGFTRDAQRVIALDKTTFRPLAFDGVTLTFIVEDGKVTGMTLKQGPRTTQMKRVETSQ